MFRIPGTTMQARVFDRVETVDPQYNIYDVGVRHDDGGIDSLAFGGSFHSAKQLVQKLNADADKAASEKKDSK